MESSQQAAASSGADKYIIDLKNKDFKIGEGAFADVHIIFRKKNFKKFAAKVLKVSPDYMTSYEKLGHDRELKILRKMDHPLV